MVATLCNSKWLACQTMWSTLFRYRTIARRYCVLFCQVRQKFIASGIRLILARLLRRTWKTMMHLHLSVVCHQKREERCFLQQHVWLGFDRYLSVVATKKKKYVKLINQQSFLVGNPVKV